MDERRPFKHCITESSPSDPVVCQNTIEPFRGPDIDKYKGHTNSMIPDHGR